MIELGEIVLRPLECKDVEFLYEYRNDCQVIQHLGGFSAGYSHENLAEWVKHHRNRADEVLWTIAEKETDRAIGHVGLYEIDNRVRKAEFGIMIGDKNAWGKGIGRRVMQAVVGWGFSELNLHKVTLTVLMLNQRAIRLYETLGFRREGVLRDEQFRNGEYMDVLLMSVKEDEWREAVRP